MLEQAEAALSELLRERLRLDAEVARYQRAVTVLFVDIVGSTRFYERYGDVAGLAMVQQFLDKLVPVVQAHSGIVVKTIGDAILARFPTALDAVHCALGMQFSLLQYNAGRPLREQIHIRVALNSGFALIKGEDVFGDVVNVCSRIESAAQPDDILMSPSVYELICQYEEIAVRKRAEAVQLKGKEQKLDLYEVVWRFGESVGPAPPRPSESQVALAALPDSHEPHEIPVAVPAPAEVTARPRRAWPPRALIGAALAVIVVAVAAAFWLGRGKRGSAATAAEAVTPSIAVLPFVDLSPEKNQEYFSDGLAEELLNDLAKIPGLRVTARMSSFQFKGKNEDVRTIGKKLNVGAILEGSVRKEGRRVRIAAQLIKTADGFHLWSETYERELNDIFAVQEGIAQAVASSLQVKLLGGKAARPSTQPRNVEAYNAYLQGRYFYERRTSEDLQKATAYYEQAIKLDPDYAAAWAGLAAARSTQARMGFLPLPVGYEKAREETERALALDPGLADAHAALGLIKRTYDWDWAGADTCYQRALALEPGNAAVIQGAAWLAADLNRFEDALRLDRQALQLDPLRASAHHALAFHAWWAGRLDESSAAVRQGLKVNPEFPWLHIVLSRVYLAWSRPQEALAEAQREQNPVMRLQGLALTYHALAQEQQSAQALRSLIANYQADAAFQIAEVYAFRGESDRAFEWLDRAYAQRDGGLPETKGDPLLKNLEHDPRYAAFLKKLRLPL
jgi:TolB-like protein/class 3 adenylate cyclase/Tfp pilus assembly protein PilF